MFSMWHFLDWQISFYRHPGSSGWPSGFFIFRFIHFYLFMTVQSLLGQVDNSTTATDNCQMECVEDLSYQRRLCFEVGFLISPRSQELTSIFRFCVFCFSTPEGLGEDLTGVKKKKPLRLTLKDFFLSFFFLQNQI